MNTAISGIETGLTEVLVSCNMWLDREFTSAGQNLVCTGTVEIGLVQVPIEFDWFILRRLPEGRERAKVKVVIGENGTFVLTHLSLDGHLVEVRPRS